MHPKDLIPNTYDIVEPMAYSQESTSDNANVRERYKHQLVENVRLDLDRTRTKLVQIFVNTNSDFNLASGIRSGNAFAVGASIIAGSRRWNRRGAVGTHHYEHVLLTPDVKTVVQKLIEDGYTVYPVDNIPEYSPVPLQQMEFPEKTAFLYGEEGPGLEMDKKIIEACNGPMIYIPQYGSVRSINVANAASVLCYAYNVQHPPQNYEYSDC